MSAIAERVLAALDALLVARAERAAAKKVFQDDPDFVAMCEARNAMIAANRRHGVALRTLLSIGVKRNGK
jgi:hypothetical protein